MTRNRANVDELAEYSGRVALYEIDDGETHVYAAESAADAIRQHVGDEHNETWPPFTPGEELVIRKLAAGEQVEVSGIDDDTTPADVPDGGRIEGERDGKGSYMRIVATAAQWAAYAAGLPWKASGEATSPAYMISSTVW